MDFGQGQIETWEEHHPKTAQDAVEAGVREIELFGVHNLHNNVELSPCAFFPRDANHLLGQVDTGDLSAGAHLCGGRKQCRATSGRDIEYPLARFDVGNLN